MPTPRDRQVAHTPTSTQLQQRGTQPFHTFVNHSAPSLDTLTALVGYLKPWVCPLRDLFRFQLAVLVAAAASVVSCTPPRHTRRAQTWRAGRGRSCHGSACAAGGCVRLRVLTIAFSARVQVGQGGVASVCGLEGVA